MDNASEENNSPDECLNPAVRNALHMLISEKFAQQSYTYELVSATAKGDNYLGVLYRVIVKLVEPAQAAGPSQLKFILKVPPQSPIQRKQFFSRPVFLREITAYDEFLPLTAQFQKEKCIAIEDDGFYHYAACYQTISDDEDEAVFLEDLHLRGFQLFDRFAKFDSAHVTLVMITYAKLHAISFALKDQQPQKLDKYKQLEEILALRKDDPLMNNYFESLKHNALESLGKERDAMYLRKLEKYFERPVIELLIELIDGTTYDTYAVVCHGDCWSNNIMFKEEDGKPTDICLVDWQLMRYSSPLSDLMYFIFTCTTKDFRKAHYKEMLDVYYDTLAAQIKRLGSDPTTLYPRKVFDEETKRRSAIGLLFAMMVLPIITMKGEDVPDLAELSELVESNKEMDLKAAGMLSDGNINAFNVRMRDVIVDCIDYGYI